MSPPGREQRVHVSSWAVTVDRAQRGVAERLAEQAWDERDGQAADNQRADRELVVRERDKAWLEAGGATGADDQTVGVRGGPIFIGQVAEAYGALTGEPMVGRKRDQERFAEQVATFETGVFASREYRVLEVDGHVELSGPDAVVQHPAGSFVHHHPRLGM